MALIDLDDQDLAVLNHALMQMPYGTVAPLVAKISNQLAAKEQGAKDHEFAGDLGYT